MIYATWYVVYCGKVEGMDAGAGRNAAAPRECDRKGRGYDRIMCDAQYSLEKKKGQ